MAMHRTVVAARASVLALVLASGFSVSAQAQALPQPDVKDTAQAALLKEASAEYERYAAAPDAYFQFDASKTAFPCKVSATQLNELARVTDWRAAAGTTDFGHTFTDVSIHPLSGECKKGKLSGKIELIYEATRRAWGPGYDGTSRELGRITATLAKGKVTHDLELRKSTDSTATAGASGVKPFTVTTTAESPAGKFTTAATILKTPTEVKYFFKRKVGAKRLEKTFYLGATLMSVEQQDAKGRPHGASITYKDGQPTKSCFRHGKPVDAAKCPARFETI